MSKEVTNDELAVMLNKQFNFINDRFDSLENNLRAEIQGVRTELKTEIQGVRTELKTEIQGVRTELQDVRIDLKNDIYENRRRIDEIFGELVSIKMRLEKLEERTQEDADALAAEVLELHKKVNILEKEINKLKLART